VIARVRQAGTGDEADIARAEDRDLQVSALIFFGKVMGRLTERSASVKGRRVL
jgi:hypothetical protein